jgi:histidine triad (HIT) family protein
MDDCIFCKIVKGEIPCKRVYEDGHALAFLDINPRNPGHTIVIPKKHIEDIFSITEDDATCLVKAIRRVASGVRKATSISQSNGQMAGQLVPHMLFHIIPRTEAERGLGLEGVLPIKKQEEASLDSMARKISGSIPKEAAKPEPRKEEPEEKPPEEGKSPEEAVKESKSPETGKAGPPERQKIDFDF